MCFFSEGTERRKRKTRKSRLTGTVKIVILLQERHSDPSLRPWFICVFLTVLPSTCIGLCIRWNIFVYSMVTYINYLLNILSILKITNITHTEKMEQHLSQLCTVEGWEEMHMSWSTGTWYTGKTFCFVGGQTLEQAAHRYCGKTCLGSMLNWSSCICSAKEVESKEITSNLHVSVFWDIMSWETDHKCISFIIVVNP